MQEIGPSIDIESYWEYSDPAGSEQRFRGALDSATPDERLELLTQIARSLGLRQRFEEAHVLLDEVERALADAGARPRVRYLLERGRVFNSSGQAERARPLFTEAWERAQVAGLEGLAVDAAHMLAIVYSGQPEGLEWTERGLALARTSQDAKARALIPAMLNNGAWELHDLGRYEEALPLFEQAETEWAFRGKAPQIHAAKWAVARCLRSLGRHDDAMRILRELEDEGTLSGSSDGSVLEEIGENLSVLGRVDEAAAYFGRAYDALSADEWVVENDAARLADLKRRAGRT